MMISRAFFSFFLGLLFLSACADRAQASKEIDSMVDVLSEKVIAGDIPGYARSVSDFIKLDTRFFEKEEDHYFNSIKKQMGSVKKFGRITNHAVISKKVCSGIIARVLWLAYAEKGQLMFEYWFFRVDKKWSLAHMYFKGHSEGGTFLKDFRARSDFSC